MRFGNYSRPFNQEPVHFERTYQDYNINYTPRENKNIPPNQSDKIYYKQKSDQNTGGRFSDNLGNVGRVGNIGTGGNGNSTAQRIFGGAEHINQGYDPNASEFETEQPGNNRVYDINNGHLSLNH